MRSMSDDTSPSEAIAARRSLTQAGHVPFVEQGGDFFLAFAYALEQRARGAGPEFSRQLGA
jgi:hypothetical protein